MLLQHLGARWHEEHVPAVLARIEVAGGAGSADDRLAGRVAVESELVSFYARRGARILNLALGDSGTVSGGCSSEIVLVLQAEGDELSRELVRSWVRTTRPKMADPVVEDLAGRPAVAILSVDRLDDLLRRQARGEAPVTATPAAVGSRR